MTDALQQEYNDKSYQQHCASPHGQPAAVTFYRRAATLQIHLCGSPKAVVTWSYLRHLHLGINLTF